MTRAPAFAPEVRYALLGDDFGDGVTPAEFPQAIERFWNTRWAHEIGLGDLTPERRIAYFARFEPLPGYDRPPVAMRYHGHQFRHYNPRIGDGRGFLFAQFRAPDGRLLDFGTKGSGQTPWSRTADGRLTLKGAVREVLAAQMLEALGVYTSKAFAVFETGEALTRHDEPSPTRSAVLTRLQHSHVRFGSFQRHAFENRPDNIAALLDHCVAAYYPHLEQTDGPARAAAFLDAVVRASARLAAQWMAAGFVHGVLNTDNLNVTGESFDYGPWRFLPHYEPGFTAAYFDETGLYCYARQPEAVFWALQQLAGALLAVGEREALVTALNEFPAAYKAEVQSAFLRRLGLKPAGEAAGEAVLKALLDFMRESAVAWEAPFFDWFGGEASAQRALAGARKTHYAGPAFAALRAAWADHEADRPQRLEHPYFAREAPVHLTIEVMEAAWAPVHEADDWSALTALLADIGDARRACALGHGRTGFLEG